jgi:two-component system sensor histidine kinase/response regulator
VVNLVGNAIKFTGAGEVVLEVRREAESNGDVELCFTVNDTGIGIPADAQATIFDAFEQADSSPTRKYEGSGLGLAICSRLVHLMGGQIWVESEVGRGSAFSFAARFPLCQDGIPEVPPVSPAQLQDLRILVVDDNRTNRRILEEMLRSWSMVSTSVSGARDAFRSLRQAQRVGHPYSLLLTDANMPEQDGFSLAQQVKQDADLSETIVIMLTSGGRPGEIARSEQLGIAAYLLKPVKQAELFDAIVAALGLASATDEAWAVPLSEGSSKLPALRILLVEDSVVNQKLAVGLLKKHDHTVVVANHGKEALEISTSQDFDLILMDVQMPEMDGFEATRNIREREKREGGHVPIIAMTAHALTGDRQRCLAAGMDEYVPKPIRLEDLLGAIHSVLRGSGRLDDATEPQG